METEISIFTPTYNRGYILAKCYESLKEQTCKKFEWIIIDDGSTDNTSELVNNWIKNEKTFQIIYKKIENGGKHKAINRGIELSKSRLFFIVDSDDYLTPNAIEKILKCEETIKNERNYAGIGMQKGYASNKSVGTTFKGQYIDATSLERKKYNINGDKAEVFYTEILKHNKFPEFEGEKFMTEALVWNRIAREGYKIRWFQDIVYICDYLEDGLTKSGNSKYKNSPQGTLLYLQEYIKDNNLGFLRRCLQYEHYSNAIYDNKNIKKAAEDLNIKPILIKVGIILRNILKMVRK